MYNKLSWNVYNEENNKKYDLKFRKLNHHYISASHPQLLENSQNTKK